MHGMQLKMILEDLSKIAISAAKKLAPFWSQNKKRKRDLLRSWKRYKA